MIDINELRRLAQAATPGPWIAKNVSGAGLEIHMSHPVYPDKDWPAFGTDSAFCKKGLVSYETWTQFPHEVQNVQQSKNAAFIAAANPAAISELLDRLEAAEKERDELRNEIACVKEVEFPRKAQAVADAWKGKCERLEAERDALRAKIEAMEQQVPICRAEDLKHAESLLPTLGLKPENPLYALPGAKGE